MLARARASVCDIGAASVVFIQISEQALMQMTEFVEISTGEHARKPQAKWAAFVLTILGCGSYSAITYAMKPDARLNSR
jgi:hypothetical protein